MACTSRIAPRRRAQVFCFARVGLRSRGPCLHLVYGPHRRACTRNGVVRRPQRFARRGRDHRRSVGPADRPAVQPQRRPRRHHLPSRGHVLPPESTHGDLRLRRRDLRLAERPGHGPQLQRRTGHHRRRPEHLRHVLDARPAVGVGGDRQRKPHSHPHR